VKEYITMRVFVTGATGFIGSAVVAELRAAGHQVLGLTRSDAGAATLAEAGAEVHRGNLDDLDSLRSGAAAADGVIHTAYNHGFTDFAAAARADGQAITALAEALSGGDKPLVIASGIVTSSVPGQPATEDSRPEPGSFAQFRFANEEIAASFVDRGVRASAVRLSPTVHGRGDKGFVARLIAIAREKGVSAYPGEGTAHWPTVHRLDAARLFRLALESAPGGARLMGVAEEGIAVRRIAEAIGRNLELPVAGVSPDEAGEHFGFLAGILAMDLRASSERTRKELDWQPTQPGLIEDLDEGHYFTV
jgi:nucleoside-diphosphate-sugar epimerase